MAVLQHLPDAHLCLVNLRPPPTQALGGAGPREVARSVSLGMDCLDFPSWLEAGLLALWTSCLCHLDSEATRMTYMDCHAPPPVFV